jgi:mannose-6-phosphate isomerase-like protein (cupin superfamily)
MKPTILKANLSSEFSTSERCFISELWSSAKNEKVSIARARVEPGVTTIAHHLEGVDEIYLITKGKGRVGLGDLEPAEVSEGDTVIIPAGTSQRITNTGKTDLVFYCICTPRFTPECYRDEEAQKKYQSPSKPTVGAAEAVKELHMERKLDETRFERKISHRHQNTCSIFANCVG